MAKDTFKLSGLPAAEAKAKLTADREKPSKQPPAEEKVSLKPFNVRLFPEQVTALAQARVDDGVTAVARIRALIAIWQDDPDLQVRVTERAISAN